MIARLIVILLLLVQPLAQAQVVQIADDGFAFSRHDSFGMLIEKHGAMTWQDVLGTTFESKSARSYLGRYREPVWFRFTLDGSKANPVARVIFFYAETRHERVDFYMVRNGELLSHQVTGNLVPFAERQLKARRLGARLGPNLDAPIEVLIRIESTANITNDLVIQTAETFDAEAQVYNLFIGSYFGLIALVAFISLVLYLAFRDPSYVWYATFSLSMVVALAFYQSFLDVFGWGEWASIVARTILHAPQVLGTCFTRSFLDTKKYAPRFDKVLVGLIAIGIINSGLRVYTPWNPYTGMATDIIVMLGVVMIIAAGFTCWRGGSPFAGYFVISWTIFLGSVFIWFLGQHNFLPYNFLTLNISTIGHEIESLILCTAMLERIRRLSHDKQHAALLATEREHLGSLVRVLAHDLTNQAHVLLGWARIGLSDNQIPAHTKAFERIRQATENIMDIIEHVKNSRAVAEGKLVLDIERIPVFTAIEQIKATFEEKLQQKSLTLAVTGADTSRGLSLLGNRAALTHSILGNLFSNAIKFSHPGGAIEVRAYTEGRRVVIEIEDHGIGIPDEILPHLFSSAEPTTRVGTSGERGTGFGMPLVKTYVEHMGGEITIDSREVTKYPNESGTLIRLKLPAAAPGKKRAA